MFFPPFFYDLKNATIRAKNERENLKSKETEFLEKLNWTRMANCCWILFRRRQQQRLPPAHASRLQPLLLGDAWSRANWIQACKLRIRLFSS